MTPHSVASSNGVDKLLAQLGQGHAALLCSHSKIVITKRKRAPLLDEVHSSVHGVLSLQSSAGATLLPPTKRVNKHTFHFLLICFLSE